MIEERNRFNFEENTVSKLNFSNPIKKTSFWEILKFAIIAALIVIPVRIFIAQPFVVSGASMVPTFKDKQYLIVDEISFYQRNPLRGEVIVFHYPKDVSKYFIKRVIGLPGETLKIHGNTITVINSEHPDGFLLDETYVKNFSSDSIETTLTKDQYYVMGDNRVASADSRSWGPLERKYVVGRVFLRLFPLSEIGVLPGYKKE